MCFLPSPPLLAFATTHKVKRVWVVIKRGIMFAKPVHLTSLSNEGRGNILLPDIFCYLRCMCCDIPVRFGCSNSLSLLFQLAVELWVSLFRFNYSCCSLFSSFQAAESFQYTEYFLCKGLILGHCLNCQRDN